MCGEKLMCFVLIELYLGLDVMSICMMVVEDGDVFVINGMKYYISGVLFVDFVIVMCVIDVIVMLL